MVMCLCRFFRCFCTVTLRVVLRCGFSDSAAVRFCMKSSVAAVAANVVLRHVVLIPGASIFSYIIFSSPLRPLPRHIFLNSFPFLCCVYSSALLRSADDDVDQIPTNCLFSTLTYAACSYRTDRECVWLYHFCHTIGGGGGHLQLLFYLGVLHVGGMFCWNGLSSGFCCCTNTLPTFPTHWVPLELYDILYSVCFLFTGGCHPTFRFHCERELSTAPCTTHTCG